MTKEGRAVEIAEAITALPGDDDHEAVAALFNAGEADVFRFMDEKPGSPDFYHLRDEDSAYGRWYMRLRRARNDRECSLFDRLAGRA